MDGTTIHCNPIDKAACTPPGFGVVLDQFSRAEASHKVLVAEIVLDQLRLSVERQKVVALLELLPDPVFRLHASPPYPSLSRLRYPTASETCSGPMVSEPVRSAMVRATLRRRS